MSSPAQCGPLPSLIWCSAFPCDGDCTAPACHTQGGTKLVAAPLPVTPSSSWLYLSEISLISVPSAVVLHAGHPRVWQPLLDQAHGIATMAHLLQFINLGMESKVFDPSGGAVPVTNALAAGRQRGGFTRKGAEK